MRAGQIVPIAVAIVAAIGCIAIAYLLLNISQRKQEARNPIVRVVELTDDTADAEVWGQNFPQHYEDYLKTADMVQTLYGGSEAIPNVPTDEDPRDIVSKSKLGTIPQLKRMWAGYAFSKDFREERGHAYMLEDQVYTERQKVGQPGTCINCHGSTYPAMKKLGDGDIMVGFEKLNQMPYDEAHTHVTHAIACIDCHEAETMKLRVTRPAFMEGIAAVKALEGIQNYEVNKDATRQEMRTYVCAQCHVEYYFKGETKRLTYPWDKGLTVDAMYEYYEDADFKDWTHAETGAPMLKAQHPEYELWTQGTHARHGVTCADCHMPYKRVGGTKVSEHKVQSPLLMTNNACATCHKKSDAEIVAWAESIQTRHRHGVELALDALVDLIDDIKAAKEAGATDEQLAAAQQFQRKASFYVDWVEAENSSGFHASQEAMRILVDSVDLSRKGQLAIRDAMTPSTVADADKPAAPQLVQASTSSE